MTLNDDEGHSPIQAFSSGTFRTVVQPLTRSQLALPTRSVPLRYLSFLLFDEADPAYPIQCWKKTRFKKFYRFLQFLKVYIAFKVCLKVFLNEDHRTESTTQKQVVYLNTAAY